MSTTTPTDPDTKTTPFMTRLDPETSRRVKAMALRGRRSISQTVALLVERGLEKTPEVNTNADELRQAS